MTASITALAPTDATPKRDIGFLHAGIIQAGLPRNAVEGREFRRTNGKHTLIVKAGELGEPSIPQPVPYGALARLILVYVCTKAVEGKFQQTTIDLEGSVNAFMTRLGVSTSGYGYRTLRTQMNAVAACSLSFISGEGETTQSFLRPVREFTSVQATEDGKPAIWPRELVLSRDFLEALRGHAVPLDYEALGKLKGSALALDAYAWLAYKLPNMTRADEYLSWEAVKGQFGHEYRSVDEFRRDMKAAIIKALAEYSAAKVEFPYGRLRLFRSEPPVGRKGAVVVALPSPAVVAPADPVPATPAAPGLGCDGLEMDDALIDAFRKARAALPNGFDRHAILADYKRHMATRPTPKRPAVACVQWAIMEARKAVAAV